MPLRRDFDVAARSRTCLDTIIFQVRAPACRSKFKEADPALRDPEKRDRPDTAVRGIDRGCFL